LVTFAQVFQLERLQPLLSPLSFGKTDVYKLSITPSFLTSALLIVGGALIRFLCYRALGRFFTFEVAIRSGHKLVTFGPYAWCRHPGYLGALACYSGISLWLTASGGWTRESGLLSTIPGRGILLTFVGQTVFTLTGLMKRMREEDRLLQNEFGAEWNEWAEKVPYVLIPGIY
jgi:protein-S-isoprenylcysteine O-methyltransferase Ste14